MINNAAARIGDYTITEDGFESQFHINHLSPFLFTNLILPRLLAARTSTYSPRVVFVSSEAHVWGTGIHFDDLTFNNGADYKKWTAYAQTKSANILTAIEFSKRHAKDGLLAFSIHPGCAYITSLSDIWKGNVDNDLDWVVIWTNISENVPLEDMLQFGMVDKDRKPINGAQFQWKTIPQGAAT